MPIWRILIRTAVVAVIAIVGVLVYRALSRYSLQDVEQSLSQINGARLVAAMAFAACSYLCLTGFDWLALRYAGHPLSWRRAAIASFTSLSIGHNVGVAALSSGAVRYRFYSRWGLGGQQVAKVVLFCGVAVGLGLAGLGGIALALLPEEANGMLGLDRATLFVIALACLATPFAYVGLAAILRKPLKLWKWSFGLPEPKMAIAQTVVGTANFAFVAACLHQLISALSEVGYLTVAAAYAVGNGAALVSHVPGGLGVLEATVLQVLPEAGAIGAVIAFRVIYFFVPLAIGLPLFLICEHVLGKKPESSEEGAANP